MTTNAVDFVEVNEHDFRVLIVPFKNLPFKRMMPMIDLSIKSPQSPELFAMLVEVFTEHLPFDKISEFESKNMHEAADIIAAWMASE